jgi:hypothetical protein
VARVVVVVEDVISTVGRIMLTLQLHLRSLQPIQTLLTSSSLNMQYIAHVLIFLLGISVAGLSEYLSPQKIQSYFHHLIRGLRHVLGIFSSDVRPTNPSEIDLVEDDKALIMTK